MSTYIYSDMDGTLDIGPTGEVAVVYDEDVIKKSIKTIFATISGERVRNPIGSALVGYLFQPMNRESQIDITNEIRVSVSRFEPRIQILSIDVLSDIDKNIYEVFFKYRISGLSGVETFETKLKRFGI